MILLEAHALACRLGSTQAVAKLDLSLGEGELVGLIGPDGAGKTTSFRMLAGLQRPTGGELQRHLDRQAFSYVPQTFSLAPDLTVLENMQFQAGLYGLAGVGPRIQRLLESMELDAFQGRLSGDLSGGMKQKLALCTALLTEPRLLLLDEPTTGVDPVSRREFWELLHQVHGQGVAILFSTPYLDEAEYAHRMLLMHEGRILQEGTLGDFRQSLPGLVFSDHQPPAAPGAEATGRVETPGSLRGRRSAPGALPEPGFPRAPGPSVGPSRRVPGSGRRGESGGCLPALPHPGPGGPWLKRSLK
jgi:ABC-2 type transport system ATP-binding protein